MKKTVAIILILALAATLAIGCDSSAKKESEPGAQNTQNTQNTQSTQGAQGDQGAQSAQPSQSAPITLKANNFGPAVLPFGQGLEHAKEYIERESNGTILIETYHDGTLLSFPDTFQGVSQGVADIGIVGPAAIDSVTTLNTIFSLVQKYLPANPHDTTKAVYELIGAVPELQEEMETFGLRWVGMFAQAGANIHCRGIKVKTPEDMKGVTFQTIGSVADFFKDMGANGLNIDPAEVYVSFERGVFQADVSHWATTWGYKVIELTDYHLNFGAEGGGLFFGIMGFIINADTWKKLTPEQQKIVWDGFREGADYALDEDILASEEAYAYAARTNQEIVALATPEELAPWHERVDGFQASWVKRVTDAGHPVAQAVLDKLQELLAKY